MNKKDTIKFNGSSDYININTKELFSNSFVLDFWYSNKEKK